MEALEHLKYFDDLPIKNGWIFHSYVSLPGSTFEIRKWIEMGI
jgi:hypothetical protein